MSLITFLVSLGNEVNLKTDSQPMLNDSQSAVTPSSGDSTPLAFMGTHTTGLHTHTHTHTHTDARTHARTHADTHTHTHTHTHRQTDTHTHTHRHTHTHVICTIMTG